MLRRRRFDDDEENHDRWLLSYADFITLLFAFFVVMYATSTINLNKYKALSSAVVSAFQGKSGQDLTQNSQSQPILHNQTTVMKPLPLSYLYREKKIRDQEKLHALGQLFSNALSVWIEQKKLTVYDSERGIHIDIPSSFVFKNDKSTLNPEAMITLNIINDLLKNEYRKILIESHTDRHLLKSEDSAWIRTSTQSGIVAQYLVSQGLPGKQVIASGLANTQPISISDNAIAQALNERISIWILTAESGELLSPNLSTQQEISPASPDKPQVKESINAAS